MKRWIKKYNLYFGYVLKHKWYVFLECCRMGIIWQGVTHDLSKCFPSEFIPYAEFCYVHLNEYKADGRRADYTLDCMYGWNLHQKRNKHHWQYWVIIDDNAKTVCVPIPDKYRKELLADWIGANKSQDNNDSVRTWYLKNKNKILLHPDTRNWIEEQIQNYDISRKNR